MQPVSNNKRIAKNTLFLYIRTIFTMVVSLYTSRIVLATLGVDDFGIYNVVGGIVMFLSFLNTSMAGATQRFLNFEFGKNDMNGVKRVFSNALIIHFIIAFIVFSSRNSTQNITANRSSWSTVLSYLKSHPAFLGTKQDRFYILLPSGNPDCVTVVKDGKVIQSPKVNRPKALCFDYLQLKEMFGLDLETEVITENSEDDSEI